MEIAFPITLYIVIALEIILIESYKRKHGLFYFDFLTMLNLFYLLAYLITPIFYLKYSESFILLDTNNIDYIATLTFISYQMIVIGWVLGGILKLGKAKYASTYIDANWLRLSKRFIFIAILMVGLLIYGSGGLGVYLSGALTRYQFEDREAGAFSFLSRATNITTFLCAIFFTFLISNKKLQEHKNIKLFFYLALSLSLLQVIGNASRGGLLNIFVILGLTYVVAKSKIKLLPMSILFVFVYTFILYGKQTFYAISNSIFNNESFIESFIYMNDIRTNLDRTGSDAILREFAHPFTGLDTAIRYEGVGYSFSYFGDFIWSILRILPRRLTSTFIDLPQPLHITNTSLLTGISGSVGVPPGLVASFYYSLGIFGVFLGSFLYGFIGRIVNNTLKSRLKQSTVYAAPFAFFSYYYGFFMVNGDPTVYIYNLIMPTLFLILLNFISKNKNYHA